jgi:polar amino acid transport system substrate-binding protein
MRQLCQDPKSGVIEIVDVAEPALLHGALRVRNACSAISPGTERSAVAVARSSYLKTARERPDLVRRVVEVARREGVVAAYRKVQARLAEPKTLGYSSAGTVVDVGDGVGGVFAVGDRVACAGFGYASHAEVICVPVNLAARIPDGVSFEHAAFSTIGAIALHGVRQAAPTLGERFAVIGLGIVGQLAAQLLRAHGARVAGFDLAANLVERARALGAEAGVAGSTEDQVAAAKAWTENLGVDGVIVTASSSSDAPMVAAAEMCRDRARVVAVGAVPFGLPRHVAYEKELELRISRSYGPGRYDPEFEERGNDYPVGYVRWTETRNLEAFLQLLAERRIELEPLITHRVSVDEAPRAYEALASKEGEPPLGMVIRYPEASESRPRPPVTPKPAAKPMKGEIGVAFIGAGGFAKGVLLPEFQKHRKVVLRRVVTSRGLSARDVQQRFGFLESGTDFDEVFRDPAIGLVCIATRHDLHASLAVRALRADKHVFVEKPLALDDEQLRTVERSAEGSSRIVMVGLNRRFSPLAVRIRETVAGLGPLLVTYRVNAGALPPGHWANDPVSGGGRLIGEGCHFFDLCSYLTGDAGIVAVEARAAGRARGLPEDFAAQLSFADGSVAQILYTAKGDPRLGKERVEVHAGGVSAIIEDYHTGSIHRGGKTTNLTQAGKGHAEEVQALLAAVGSGGPPPIPMPVLLGVTRATFEAQRQIAGGTGPIP